MKSKFLSWAEDSVQSWSLCTSLASSVYSLTILRCLTKLAWLYHPSAVFAQASLPYMSYTLYIHQICFLQQIKTAITICYFISVGQGPGSGLAGLLWLRVS